MDLLRAMPVGEPVTWWVAATAMLLAFGLGQAVALTYVATFRGLSYSRSYVQGIALGAIVTCMLMLAIGDSIAAGIGLAGGLSIIRFRTTMRDPRDMVFVFAGLGVGIVCGLKAWPTAVVGTTIFCAAVVLLDLTSFGTRQHHDAMVRFLAPAGASDAVRQALVAGAPDHALVALRQAAQGQDLEHAYQVHLPEPSSREGLIRALEAAGGRNVRVFLLQTTEEL